MKRYGDTWGCCANTAKSHILLVGPSAAVQEAQRDEFRWGCSPLQVVDKVKYLGLWFTSDWSWDTHIAAAYRKGLGAFHAWRRVLVSPRVSVSVKLRVFHSVIRPVLEYGMEVWGPVAPPLTRTRRQGGSRPPSALHLFDDLLLSACRLACGVRALPGEPGWTRRACVTPEVLLSACRVLPSERACDLAHLRYSERLRAASRHPQVCRSHLFRDAAHAALPSDHPWLRRVQASSQLLPHPLPSVILPNRHLRERLHLQTSAAWVAALAPCPASDNVSARGRRRGPGPPRAS
jgi:hypothetical protein